jgi:hypothetical protein
MPFWASSHATRYFGMRRSGNGTAGADRRQLEFTFEELPTTLIQRNRIHKPIHIRRSLYSNYTH